MPGKRYDLRLTAGPYKGCRARLRGSSVNIPGSALVEMKDITDAQGHNTTLEFPWQWLERIRNKTTLPARTDWTPLKNARAEAANDPTRASTKESP